MTGWLLIVLMWAADGEPAKPVVRVFEDERSCVAERDHLWLQARETTVAHGLIAWCEGKA